MKLVFLSMLVAVVANADPIKTITCELADVQLYQTTPSHPIQVDARLNNCSDFGEYDLIANDNSACYASKAMQKFLRNVQLGSKLKVDYSRFHNSKLDGSGISWEVLSAEVSGGQRLETPSSPVKCNSTQVLIFKTK